MATQVDVIRGDKRAARSARTRFLLALAGVLLTVAVAAMPALARLGEGSVQVSGTYEVYDLGSTECSPVAASPLLECATTALRSSYSGDLVGDVVSDFTNVINCQTGRTTGNGVETFTGSLDGSAQGTLSWKISFVAEFDCATFFPSGFRGLGVIRSSSGGLDGIHGLLRFGDVTYHGVLR